MLFQNMQGKATSDSIAHEIQNRWPYSNINVIARFATTPILIET